MVNSCWVYEMCIKPQSSLDQQHTFWCKSSQKSVTTLWKWSYKRVCCQEEMELVDWNRQLEQDAERLKSEANRQQLRMVWDTPLSVTFALFVWSATFCTFGSGAWCINSCGAALLWVLLVDLHRLPHEHRLRCWLFPRVTRWWQRRIWWWSCRSWEPQMWSVMTLRALIFELICLHMIVCPSWDLLPMALFAICFWICWFVALCRICKRDIFLG